MNHPNELDLNKQLDEQRKNIDLIDEQILELFIKRMETVANINHIKQELQLPTLISSREKDMMITLIEKYKNSSYLDYLLELQNTMISLSKQYQNNSKK